MVVPRKKMSAIFAVGLALGLLLPALAFAELSYKEIITPYPIRVAHDADFSCRVSDEGAVECDVIEPHVGTVTVKFPAGTTTADDSSEVLIDVRNVAGRTGVRIDGVKLPDALSETIIMPRPQTTTATRLCIRDYPNAEFVSPTSPCFDAIGQGRIFLPPGNGQFDFRLNDGFSRRVSYDAKRINLSGVRHTMVVFDHNSVPIGNDDYCAAYEDRIADCSILHNDLDMDGDVIEIVEVGRPLFGRAVLKGSVVEYKPPEEWFGTDYFDYIISDGRSTAMAGVTVKVAKINDPPEPIRDVVALNEDEQVTFDVVWNDRDRDSATLRCTGVQPAEHGTVTLADGMLTYVPGPNWFGREELIYTVEDTGGATAEGGAFVVVTSVNDAPVAEDVKRNTDEDVAISGQVRAADVDNDSLRYFIVKAPANGTVEMKDDGTYTYSPNLDYFGEDVFAFYAFDGTTNSNPGTVTIEITEVFDEVAVANGGGATSVAKAIDDYAAYNSDLETDRFGILAGIEMARQAVPLGEVDLSLVERLRTYDVPVYDTAQAIGRLLWDIFYNIVLAPIFE